MSNDPYRTCLPVVQKKKSLWKRFCEWFWYKEDICAKCKKTALLFKKIWRWEQLGFKSYYEYCGECAYIQEKEDNKKARERWEKREYKEEVEKQLRILKVQEEAKRIFEKSKQSSS